jgi:hypothetical protein
MSVVVMVVGSGIAMARAEQNHETGHPLGE